MQSKGWCKNRETRSGSRERRCRRIAGIAATTIMNGSRWALHVKLRFVCTPIACCLIIQKDLLFPLAERMDNHNRRLRRDGTFVIGANPDGTLPSAGNSGNGVSGNPPLERLDHQRRTQLDTYALSTKLVNRTSSRRSRYAPGGILNQRRRDSERNFDNAKESKTCR